MEANTFMILPIGGKSILRSKVFDFAKDNKIPTTRNYRIFEVAKELYLNGDRGYGIDVAIDVATNLVDKVGIETV